MSRVYLVGAGPGDPDLLTVRAAELLRSVDVVAHDELISPSILARVGHKVELISVGYRGYGSSKLGYRMHPIIIERVLQGKTVVRLKSGDPLIFGRAVQECEELREHGIPFEIIPGITSGMGAAAYAGIPLTHRSCSSDVIITSGHDLRGGSQSNSNWEALGKSTGTLLIYMAASKIKENCDRLISYGRSAQTAAAFISNASRASQKVITGTLANLNEQVGPVDKKIPALIVVGDVVHQRSSFNWLEHRPLHDVSVLLVRARRGESRIARLLKDTGADVIEAPRIWTEELGETSEDSRALDSAIQNISKFKRLIFSCEEGIPFFFKRMIALGLDSRKLSGLQIVTMGTRVRDALANYGITTDLFIEGHCFQAISDKAPLFDDGASCVVTSKRGRSKLSSFLKQLSIPATFVAAYRYRHEFPTFTPPSVDFIILPSSTSATLLLDGPWRENYLNSPMIALGPVTRAEALRLGAKTVYQTATDQIGDLIPLLRELRNELHPAKPKEHLL
jgi:uroporphyrinogen III methyltransferase/synthase